MHAGPRAGNARIAHLARVLLDALLVDHAQHGAPASGAHGVAAKPA
jgi:hypothetical protein